METIYTIELNLDDDYANACAYHVCDFNSTYKRNINHAIHNEKTNRWVLVGLAHSLKEGCEKAKKLRLILCEMNNKFPYGMVDLLFEDKEELMKKCYMEGE